MALFGSIDTISDQLTRRDHFAAAFHYLRQALDPTSSIHARILAVPVGETHRIDLAGGAFALEQGYVTKLPAEGRYEAHAAYVDLQAIVQGDERIDVIDVRHLTERENQLAERDVRFFDDHPAGSAWRVAEGEIAVFFPADAHRPSLALGEPQVVHKTVVKVPVPA